MGDSQSTASNATDLEAEWFSTNHNHAMSASRRFAEMYHRLDAALTMAYAAGDGTNAAMVVKHEVDDGLKDDLKQFRLDCLIGIDLDTLPRLAAIWTVLDATLENLDQNESYLTRSRTADTAALQSLLWQFRDLRRSVDALIDDSLKMLLPRSPAIGDAPDPPTAE